MVRRDTFFLMAKLVLKDMIKVQGHMSEMARCIIDSQEELKDMSKQFFMLLAAKANSLYNVLPDIFSHLIDDDNMEEENLRAVMR